MLLNRYIREAPRASGKPDEPRHHASHHASPSQIAKEAREFKISSRSGQFNDIFSFNHPKSKMGSHLADPHDGVALLEC